MQILINVWFLIVFCWNFYSLLLLAIEIQNPHSQYPLGRPWAFFYLIIHGLEAGAICLAFLIINAKL